MKDLNISELIKNSKTSRDLRNVLIHQFFNYMPNNLEHAVNNQFDEDSKTAYNHMDYVDFHYRRYLIGQANTMHRVLSEIRQFMKLSNLRDSFKEMIIRKVMYRAEVIIMQNELYELMPRQLKARKKIRSMFGIELE